MLVLPLQASLLKRYLQNILCVRQSIIINFEKNCHNCLKKVILRDILLLELVIANKGVCKVLKKNKLLGSVVNKIFLEGKEKLPQNRLIVRKSKSKQFLGSRLK